MGQAACAPEPGPGRPMHLEKWFFRPRLGKPPLILHHPHLQTLVLAGLGKPRPSTRPQTLTATYPALPPRPPLAQLQHTLTPGGPVPTF